MDMYGKILFIERRKTNKTASILKICIKLPLQFRIVF